MKRLLQILILIFLIIGCNSAYKKINKGYTLKGKTNGLKDGTLIQLKDNYSNKIIDSTRVKNDKFKFKGKLANHPVQVMVLAGNDYKFIWIENKTIVLDSYRSSFGNSKIIGSETQALEDQFYDSQGDINDFNVLNEMNLKFIEEHPNSVISAKILLYSFTHFGKSKVEELYNQFSDKNKENVYSQRIEEVLELSKNPKIGEQYVDFEMEDDAGNNIVLSENLGKITLLEFWSSWCGPCRTENPNLVKAYKKFNNKGFEIISVSVDDDGDGWKKAIADDKLPWIQLCDLKGGYFNNKARLIYGIDAIPDNFLINENGEIIGRNLKGEDLVMELEKLFN